MNATAARDNTNQTIDASLITCSFSGDFEICKLLCQSVDQFVPEEIAHIIYVPARDVALFGSLATQRRKILTQEELLPKWFVNLPLPGPKWRARLHLPRRNIYLTPYSLPVRGWIAQQIMKIAATRQAQTSIVIHVDSDNAFVRPLSGSHLVQNGRTRLYRDPQMVEQSGHRQWHCAAGQLLGLPQQDFYDGEYIDQLVVWRRDVLAGMIEEIEKHTGTDWRIALSRTSQFAEYILYGVYADKVVGLDHAGLFATAQSLCLSRWAKPIEDEADENAFIASIKPEHIACLIQSTIGMPLEARQHLFTRATAAAARQDQSAP